MLHCRLAGSLLLSAFTRTQAINDDFLVASFMFQGDVASMTDNASLIIYDGDCIFCHNYVRLMRLRASLGNVELIDVRSGDPRVRSYWSQGYDLNTGHAVHTRGKIYQGAEAVHILGRLSSGVFWFNRLNRFVFSSRMASTLRYPILKLGRLMALTLRRRNLMVPPSLRDRR